jgi:PhoH-like ATPase
MQKGARHSRSSQERKPHKKEKIYVVDTNVIINDPNIIKKLNGKVFVPTTVLSELDKHKHGHSEKARNVREFARYIERNQDKVWFHNSERYEGTADEKIIESARNLSDLYDVTMMTNDILMGALARARNLNVERYEMTEASADTLYRGVLTGQAAEIARDAHNKNKNKNLNQYMVFHDGIYRSTHNGLIKLGKDFQLWGITHKNLEQRCALDALLDENIKLVTLTGKAGTGKTLLAIVSALESVITRAQYKRMIVARPVIPMGQDLGYLPGDLNEKLAPWMQPIMDNIEFLFENSGGKKNRDAWEDLTNEGILKMEALSYIRGRSIPNEFIIIDEAQNLTRHEVKTIISRAGENTKIILTGDIYQIDNPKVDSMSNGLSYVIDKFKDQAIAAHIHFSKCERSELAELASELL